ncbi:MAG: CarD family transcriptional regulator [Tissierellia bacterium]|nr:CarD family transcriptional regulator [Tissierellia bacterium]
MFKVGEKIVYPMHGAGVIEKIEEKEILGERREYFIIKMPIGDMKVMVPVTNVEEVGVREIISEEEVAEVMEVLEGHKTKMPQNWNRRYRANMERIKTGDILEIASVVRNLTLLDNEKSLSTGERKMLSNAKQMLLSELVLVTDETMEVIEEKMNLAILENEGFEEDEIEEEEEEVVKGKEVKEVKKVKEGVKEVKEEVAKEAVKEEN